MSLFREIAGSAKDLVPVAVRHFSTGDLYVVNYHDIDDYRSLPRIFPRCRISPRLFERHLNWYEKHFDFVDPSRLVDKTLCRGSKPQLLLTFDDGYASVLKHALPILRQRRIPALAFVATEPLFEGTWPWDYVVAYCFRRNMTCLLPDRKTTYAQTMDHYKTCYRSEQLLSLRQMILGKTAWHLPRLHMTPEDLRNALSKHGDLLFLGSHTHRHFSLAKLDEGTLKFEIVQCHRRIESEFSNVLPCFAAPFGQYEHFDQRAIDMFRTAADGFFFTTIPGPNAIGNDRKVMFRTSGEHFSIRSLSKGFEL